MTIPIVDNLSIAIGTIIPLLSRNYPSEINRARDESFIFRVFISVNFKRKMRNNLKL